MSGRIKTRPVEKKWNKIGRTGDSLSLCCRARDRHTDWPTAIHVTEVKNTFCLSLTFGSIPFSTAFNQFCSALLMTATSVTFYPIPSHPNLLSVWLLYLFAQEERRGEERRVVVNRVLDWLLLWLLCWLALPHCTTPHRTTHQTLNQLAFSTIKCSRMIKEEERLDEMRRDRVSTPHHTCRHTIVEIKRDTIQCHGAHRTECNEIDMCRIILNWLELSDK